MKIPIQDGGEPPAVDVSKSPAKQEETLEPSEPASGGDDAPKGQKRKKSRLEKKELPKKKKDEINKLKEIISNLTEELIKREQKLIEAQEKAVRSMADADNYKKRMARESEEQAKYATALLIENLLPVLDNLDKAGDAVNDGHGGIAQLSEGVRLTHEQFLNILKKHGLERLDVVNKPFDPNVSEAITMEDTTEHEDGTVIREFVPGYRFKERVIRPAKVQIARNQPHSMEPSEDEVGADV